MDDRLRAVAAAPGAGPPAPGRALAGSPAAADAAAGGGLVGALPDEHDRPRPLGLASMMEFGGSEMKDLLATLCSGSLRSQSELLPKAILPWRHQIPKLTFRMGPTS